jgi:putative flavoprotein involved in K+ transport
MTTYSEIIIIGGGQSGLACAYYLRRKKLDFLILDNQESSGGAWGNTWDSLRLFSPAEHSSLPGWLMPSSEDEYPHKDDVIRYLSNYESKYQFPVERPVEVEHVHYQDGIYRLTTNKGEYECQILINATGTWKKPFVPDIEGYEDFTGLKTHSAFLQGS